MFNFCSHLLAWRGDVRVLKSCSWRVSLSNMRNTVGTTQSNTLRPIKLITIGNLKKNNAAIKTIIKLHNRAYIYIIYMLWVVTHNALFLNSAQAYSVKDTGAYQIWNISRSSSYKLSWVIVVIIWLYHE